VDDPTPGLALLLEKLELNWGGPEGVTGKLLTFDGENSITSNGFMFLIPGWSCTPQRIIVI